MIHLAVLLLVGGIVVFKGIVPREPFSEADVGSIDPTDTAVLELPEEAEPITEMPAINPDQSVTFEGSNTHETVDTSLIVSTGTNQLFSLPVATSPTPVIGQSLTATTRTSGSPGGSATSNEASKTVMRSLFGSKVEAKKLGVVVDAFYSMAPFMEQVLPEIESKFPDAVVFFTLGCGLKSDQSTAIAVQMTKDNVMSTFFGKNQKLPVSVESPWIAQLMRSGRAYSLVKSVDKHSDTVVAFNTMVERKVDVLYWFTDFTDEYNPSHVETIARRLGSAGILVLMHHPAGTPDNFGRVGYKGNLAQVAKANMEMLEKHFIVHLPKGSGFIRKSLLE